jgi:hypothetical protein
MILMLSPAGNQTFVVPGGTYVSDYSGIIRITSNSTADQAALEAAGCVTQVPIGQASPTAGPTANAGTTAALPSCTYSNGTNGVGATLVAAANGALAAQDGVSLTVNQHLLVRRQSDMTQNGYYKLLVVGDGSHQWILVRDTSFDEPAEISYSLVTVSGGTTMAGRRYMVPLLAPAIIVGSTPLPVMAAD